MKNFSIAVFAIVAGGAISAAQAGVSIQNIQLIPGGGVEAPNGAWFGGQFSRANAPEGASWGFSVNTSGPIPAVNNWVDETWTGIESTGLLYSIEADDDPDFFINKQITNDSMFGWIGFEVVVTIDPAIGPLTILGMPSSTKWTMTGATVNMAGTEIVYTYDGGVLLPGDSAFVEFAFNIPNNPMGNFQFKIQQNVFIPTPGALAVLGMAGLLGASRRRR